MKILLAGDWHSDIHELPLSEAFQTLGHSVERFSWHDRFLGRGVSGLVLKFQNKYLIGPAFSQLQTALIHRVDEVNPDMLFVYRGSHVTRTTLDLIRRHKPSLKIIGYNNDDPFSARNPFYLWRHFKAAIPSYDLLFAYRTSNIAEFNQAGSKRTELLRSWYIPEKNKKVALSEVDLRKFSCDVAFIGHYEPDGRDQLIQKIIDAGIDFKLYGPEWENHGFSVHGIPRGDEYNRAINGAKICLCFLSRLNRDTYTRRCFEIPAAGSMLLSEYSSDLATLFQESVEAEFFRNADELIEKIQHYLLNPDRIQSVANRGKLRVEKDGHDVASRARYILAVVNSIA